MQNVHRTLIQSKRWATYTRNRKGGRTMAVMSYIEAVTLALKEEMERDENVFVLGEDVGARGGVFRAT
ncbi:alpha-ketoacid dehydrogenase subunit beta, partial [Halalkalibacterium halodurans]|nr:alpha-ketoacid dehydrogenase subunit beta [Halalkalibacterium halodurans]